MRKLVKVNGKLFCREANCVWRDKITGYCPGKGCLKDSDARLHSTERQILDAARSVSTGEVGGEELRPAPDGVP